MRVRETALAVAGCTALSVAPGAESSGLTSWWTKGHSKAYLAAHKLLLTDRSQSDHPTFDVRFSSISKVELRAVGASRSVRGRQAWRLFPFSGCAHDVLRDIDVTLRFELRPTSAGAAITHVRGLPPNRFQPSFPMRTTFYYEWFPEGWDQEGILPRGSGRRLPDTARIWTHSTQRRNRLRRPPAL